MAKKSNHDKFIDSIDTGHKQWAIGIVGLLMLIAGPVIAATFRTSPGVALISLGSILIYFAFAGKRGQTRAAKK